MAGENHGAVMRWLTSPESGSRNIQNGSKTGNMLPPLFEKCVFNTRFVRGGTAGDRCLSYNEKYGNKKTHQLKFFGASSAHTNNGRAADDSRRLRSRRRCQA